MAESIPTTVSAAPPPDTHTAVDWDRLIAVAKRATLHWKISAGVMVVGILIATVLVRARQPYYRSEVVIMYREGVRPSYLGPDSGDPLRNLAGRLKEMIVARPGLEKIIDEFKLYPEVMRKRGYVEAVNEFRNHISFKARAADTFGISFEGESPSQVQVVTARLGDSLIEENSRMRLEQAKFTAKFLEAERSRSEEELKRKEKALATFLTDHPEFALDAASATPNGGAGASIRAAAAERRSGNGTNEDPGLSALEREAPRIRSLLNARPGSVNPIVGIASGGGSKANADPGLLAEKNQAETELGAAKRDLIDKQARFTEQHPDVQLAISRLKDAEIRLRRADLALNTIPPPSLLGNASNAENPYDEAAVPSEANRTRLQAQLVQVEQEITRRKKNQAQGDGSNETANQIVAQETEWARLKRDANEARDRVADLERKFFRAQIEASSELGGYAAQIGVLDPAFKPTQASSPRRLYLFLGVFGASLLLSLTAAVVRVLVDDHLYDAADVSRLVPVLAVVPKIPTRRRRRI